MKVDKLRSDIQTGIESGQATPLDMAEIKAEGQQLRAAHLADVPNKTRLSHAVPPCPAKPKP